ncbi:DNAJ protein JJJ1 homolog [Mangifera indica]|uniref:DNAJ protein JJJ1 homolog n=1 Tax=Mangifera indica TaxID=29780 RepID=UPI001CF9F3A7|nr:DNAJ protein JJJ1 homolog [Mangifera indica]
MASPSSKRCLHEILGLTVNSSPNEIRSTYKKLALQRHPDKLLQSALTHHQATAQFKELNFAYKKIYKTEVDFVKKSGLGLDTMQEVPRMGNLRSPVKEVRVSTVVDFRWVEGKRASETEELKEEYNERVRKMAEFVRKRDKRVIDLLRKVKIEQERRQVEELEMEVKRKDYCCELCGEKFQSENPEQWRKRVQDVVEFWQGFVEEEGESEELCERCIKTTSARDSRVQLLGGKSFRI